MADWVRVAKAAEVPAGQAKVVRAEGQRLALSNVEGTYYVIEDLCTHDGGPLGEGELIGSLLECPRHGARFDVKTGRPVTLPAVIPVKTFPVKVEGEEIFVEMPSALRQAQGERPEG